MFEIRNSLFDIRDSLYRTSPVFIHTRQVSHRSSFSSGHPHGARLVPLQRLQKFGLQDSFGGRICR